MRKDKEWADAVSVQGTAWYLNHDLLIIMSTATPDSPFITISGHWGYQDSAPCAGVPLLLGYVSGLHYQSLLPLDEQAFRPASFNPKSHDDILKETRSQKDQNSAKGNINMKRKGEEHGLPSNSRNEIKKVKGSQDFTFTSASKIMTVKVSQLPGGDYIYIYLER